MQLQKATGKTTTLNQTYQFSVLEEMKLNMFLNRIVTLNFGQQLEQSKKLFAGST